MFFIPAIASIALSVLVIYRYILYPIFLSPLSKVPNAHPSSAVSPAWILWTRFKKRENSAVHGAHKKYGSVIRLAPNEISVNCVDGGIRTIYSGGFDRHEWYFGLFANYGLPNLVSIGPSKPHSVRRRMLSNIYSKSQLFSSPELHAISQTVIYDRLLPIIQPVGKSKILDVVELFYAVNMDFTSGYLFGLTNGTNFLHDEKERREWLGLYQSRKDYAFWQPELPNFTASLAKIGIHVVPKRIHAVTKTIEAWCLSMCDAADHCLTSKPADRYDPTSEPVVYKQLKTALTNDRSKIPPTPLSLPPSEHNLRLSVAAEMLDHIIAGFETSGITSTYLVHELSSRPDLQARLRAELLTLSPPLLYPSSTQAQELPSLKALDALPLLHAIIMETLRLYPPAATGQFRVTPSGTSTTLDSFTDIPPGTRVSAQAYCLHRNEDVFPEPETWRAERWLEGRARKDGESQGGGEDEKMRWFWAFGSGGRMCIGSNFAMHGLKLIAAAIYTNYTTRIVDDTGIEQMENFIAGPKGNKLIIAFERV
ncbi:hypothetical protein MMC16_006996 [Acarospora aff. strigata]|nr:hypothetical protein [Acarospora aff. strigata]